MSLPTMSGVGRLTADPDLRFSPSGVAVVTVNLAFNARRKNQQTGEWEDGDVFFVRGTAFRQEAENIAETLTKGTEVMVTGRLKTDQWEDRETGQKRSATSMLIDGIGPSLRYSTAKVQKVDRQGVPERQAAQDPWDAARAPTGGGFADEPPF